MRPSRAARSRRRATPRRLSSCRRPPERYRNVDRMAIRIVTADDVDRLLSYETLIEALAQAFRADIAVPEKIAHFVKLPSGSEAKVLLMPAWTTSGERFIGHKLVNVFPDNAKVGKPSVLGSYILMSGDTGGPLSLLGGTAITPWRTAAAPALAPRHTDTSTPLTHL